MTSNPIRQCLVLVFVLTSIGMAQTPARIQNIVSAGSLASMRWPNFRDYRTSLQSFYQPVNYAPAWVEGKAPSPQALAMIGLFQNAWKKGLEPEDYDSSRWNDRLRALEGSSADLSDFEVALTVCA